jgi:hypothetical protein
MRNIGDEVFANTFQFLEPRDVVQHGNHAARGWAGVTERDSHDSKLRRVPSDISTVPVASFLFCQHAVQDAFSSALRTTSINSLPGFP